MLVGPKDAMDDNHLQNLKYDYSMISQNLLFSYYLKQKYFWSQYHRSLQTPSKLPMKNEKSLYDKIR